MKFLLDTNICIYIMNNHPPEVLQKFKRIGVGKVGLSSITVSKLHYGACKSNHVKKNIKRLDEFLIPFEILPYNESAARYYGKIRVQFEKQGSSIGQLDMLIAAHALSENLILITNNVKEFIRIKSLQIENWVEKHETERSHVHPV